MSTEGNRSVYNLEVAYQLACEQLGKVDIEQQCHHSDAQYQEEDSQKTITISFLGQCYLISLPEIEISLAGSDDQVPKREQILILHYFTQAKGTTVSDRLVAFRELPGGSIYDPTFAKRTMKPLANYFGKEPALLITAAERLDGHEADYGDVAVVINAFSHVPITLVLWRGDDEFPPQLNLLFDASISDYLDTEDVTVLCEIITWQLINYLREA